jgi:hypothetical protein
MNDVVADNRNKYSTSKAAPITVGVEIRQQLNSLSTKGNFLRMADLTIIVLSDI